MFRAPLTLALVACTLASAAVSAQDLDGFEPSGPLATETIELDGRAGWVAPSTLREVARVETSKDNYVSWSIDDASGEMTLGIAATYPNKPLLASELAETLDPIESFLAVAGLSVPVPDALLAAAPGELPAMDAARREALRQANLVALTALTDFSGDRAPEKAACSSSFKNWVGSVYGSSTCGNTSYNGYAWANSTDTYCTSGCKYKLGEFDTCGTPALASCDIVTGTAHNRRQRWSNINGPWSMGYWGHHAHYGAANCVGNGSVSIARTRGGSVYNSTVPVNGMKHWFQGAWNLPASAATSVSYGSWATGIPPSGSLFKYNRLDLTVNSGSNDRAILCGDIKNKYTMQPPPGSCHGPNINLCYPGDCDSPCFKCSGGSC